MENDKRIMAETLTVLELFSHCIWYGCGWRRGYKQITHNIIAAPTIYDEMAHLALHFASGLK
jgi:hypothetical protein